MTIETQFLQIKNELSKFESLFQWSDFGEFLVRPKEGPRDPFWETACFVLLEEALKRHVSQEDPPIEKFYNFLKSASAQEYEDFFAGTEAATYVTTKNKSTSAIRSYLISELEDFFKTPVFSFSNGATPSHATPL